VSADGLNLTVAARAENLAVVRQALAGFAEALGFGDNLVADLKTIATEACMNVVVHAYRNGDPGPLQVLADRSPDGLQIVVRDEGTGFQPRPADPDETSLRLGLPLIALLSDGFELRGGPGLGTELRIRLSADRSPEEEQVEVEKSAPETVGTMMEVEAGSLVRPVVARVISALAARADFSIDRISDTVLIGDAVSAHDASDFRDRRVGIEILDGDGRLDVRIGPLVDGGSERILKQLEMPGGASLRKLATAVSVRREESPSGEGLAEYLVVAIDREVKAGTRAD
jgi:serine/threonine-protein kinase RsbW